MTDVKVGQIWQDNDWRVKFRQLKVVVIDGKYAHCVIRYTDEDRWPGKSRVLLSRFKPNSTGYRLVEVPK